MKKLVFLFVAFVAVSFASCGGNKNANAESTEAACDSVACDSAKACCDKAE